MTKFIVSLICVLLSVSVSAETVYKKTNPDGSVEFTDVPATDSEEVKVREPTSFAPPRLPSINQLPVKKLKPSFNYDLTISQPAEDSVINDKPDVTVMVSIQPNLLTAQNHKVRYELAGESIVSSNNTHTFKNVPRGTHSLIVTIVDQKGEVVGPIVSRTFHMKRFFKKPTPKPKVP